MFTFAALTLLCLEIVSANTPCPSDQKYYRVINDEPLNWHDAHAACQDLEMQSSEGTFVSGNLASVMSADEHDRLTRHANMSHTEKTYIAATDLRSAGMWEWADGSRTVMSLEGGSFAQWKNGVAPPSDPAFFTIGSAAGLDSTTNITESLFLIGVRNEPATFTSLRVPASREPSSLTGLSYILNWAIERDPDQPSHAKLKVLNNGGSYFCINSEGRFAVEPAADLPAEDSAEYPRYVWDITPASEVSPDLYTSNGVESTASHLRVTIRNLYYDALVRAANSEFKDTGSWILSSEGKGVAVLSPSGNEELVWENTHPFIPRPYVCQFCVGHKEVTPTSQPTEEPTRQPTEEPTSQPTEGPTGQPTLETSQPSTKVPPAIVPPIPDVIIEPVQDKAAVDPYPSIGFIVGASCGCVVAGIAAVAFAKYRADVDDRQQEESNKSKKKKKRGKQDRTPAEQLSRSMCQERIRSHTLAHIAVDISGTTQQPDQRPRSHTLAHLGQPTEDEQLQHQHQHHNQDEENSSENSRCDAVAHTSAATVGEFGRNSITSPLNDSHGGVPTNITRGEFDAL